MTREGDWVGDVGHLALADAALSEQLIDILRMLAYGDLFKEKKSQPDPGLTSNQAAQQVAKYRETHPYLVPDAAAEWLQDVVDAANERNEVLHAVALNRCVECGRATLFQHPRSGRMVDRSEAAVRELTERLLDLRERGVSIAAAFARLVNDRIVVGAKVLANLKGESIAPETVHATQVEHTCGDCNDNGRATANVLLSVGALEIEPDADEGGHAMWLEALAHPELLIRPDRAPDGSPTPDE